MYSVQLQAGFQGAMALCLFIEMEESRLANASGSSARVTVREGTTERRERWAVSGALIALESGTH
jgi:hypothetical protein